MNNAEPFNAFDAARLTAQSGCPKCKGTGSYMYDHNHGTICDLCCRHNQGYWQLLEHYGADNGKWCCVAGCGFKIETDPDVLDGAIREVTPVLALTNAGECALALPTPHSTASAAKTSPIVSR
jgi:hypothetical protein